MPTQTERKEATRARIIDAARAVFAREGYAKAPLSEIVDRSGVTTGAIYHHFGDKKGLFIAVAEHLEQEIVDEAAKSGDSSGSPWQQFESGILETLEICARPDIQRIVFREAPTVVGLDEWKTIERKYGFGLMQKSIADLADQGLIHAPDPDLTAQILLGAIMEAAHFAALSRLRKKALKQGQETVLVMLRALRNRSVQD